MYSGMDKAKLKAYAKSLGFRLVGLANPDDLPSLDFYDWWLNQGFAAEMHYLKRQRSRRKSLSQLLPGIQSVIVCALPFPGPPPEASDQDLPEVNSEPNSEANRSGIPSGKVARYAVGEDYHFVIKAKLEKIAMKLDAEYSVPKKNRSLAYVDTGAIPERSLGVLAGIGWVGKNAMLIHPEEGSWLWLGEILTTVKFTPDIPQADRCGTCRRCIDTCPTNAIQEGTRTIDSRKCISYLTIEHRGEIPEKYHRAIGDWLLGCDICQDVCPWNQQSLRKGRKKSGAPIVEQIPLQDLLSMGNNEFNTRYKKRALSRPKLKGLQRNAKIIEKNQFE